MGIFDIFKSDQRTFTDISKEVKGVFVRIPPCVIAGYFENKKTETGEPDVTAIKQSVGGTLNQVYGRSLQSIASNQCKSYIHVMEMIKEGGYIDDFDLITMICLHISIGELMYGEASIDQTRAIKSANLGFECVMLPYVNKAWTHLPNLDEDAIKNLAIEAVQNATQMSPELGKEYYEKYRKKSDDTLLNIVVN